VGGSSHKHARNHLLNQVTSARNKFISVIFRRKKDLFKMSVAEMTPAKKSLLIAIRENQVDRVKSLLTKHPNDLSPNEEADSAKNRILHRAARYAHPEIVELLLKGKHRRYYQGLN
jgi:hypothetical protein